MAPPDAEPIPLPQHPKGAILGWVDPAPGPPTVRAGCGRAQPVSGWRSINRTRSTENLAVEMHGSSAATVTWKDGDGRPDRKVHFEESLAGLKMVTQAVGSSARAG